MTWPTTWEILIPTPLALSSPLHVELACSQIWHIQVLGSCFDHASLMLFLLDLTARFRTTLKPSKQYPSILGSSSPIIVIFPSLTVLKKDSLNKLYFYDHRWSSLSLSLFLSLFLGIPFKPLRPHDCHAYGDFSSCHWKWALHVCLCRLMIDSRSCWSQGLHRSF